MTTLSAGDLLYYRRLGGIDTTELADSDIQTAFDRATAFGDNADTTEARTMVYIIRQLIGLARKKIDVRGEVEAESRSQLIKNLLDMLPEWEGLAGIGGAGIINSGTLTLHIDYNADDVITEASNTLLE